MVHRKDFIERLSQKGYAKEYAAGIVDDCIGILEEALVNGEAVTFHGFGSLEVRNRAGRKSVDLQNRSIDIPAYKAAHFTPGKALKRKIQAGTLEH